MRVSYHCHSKWSDGEGTIADFVGAAGILGLDEFGISDHYVLTPNREKLWWSMAPDALDDYAADLQAASGDALDGLTVRLGVEADFIPETVGDLQEVLRSQPFDYVIGSVHIVNGFPIDNSPADWEPLATSERDEIIRTYWIRIREMAESRLFDFAGHLDLTKKFGIYPSIDPTTEIEKALDAIAASDMAVELNTSGWTYTAREEYPSSTILRGCLERGIPVVVSADAHKPANLIRGFDDAYSLLKEIGFTEQASFAGRQRFMSPLPENVNI
jgi:histidinol-phosphatase (PHP family)